MEKDVIIDYDDQFYKRHNYNIRLVKEEIDIPQTCGTISACYVLKHLEIDYDSDNIMKDAKDGIYQTELAGANAFSLGFALAKYRDLEIELFIDLDKDLSADDQESIDNFNQMPNAKFHKSISIKEVVGRFTDRSVPIVAFWRNGDKSLPHYSPLFGISGGLLSFILDDKVGRLRPTIEEFEKDNWWNDENGRVALIVSKKK